MKNPLDHFIDENNVLKIFLNNNNNEIFANSTFLVDCPGIGQTENIDNEINKQCEDADIIIFLFDIENKTTTKVIT